VGDINATLEGKLMKKILMVPLAAGAVIALGGPLFAQSMQGQSTRDQSMQSQRMGNMQGSSEESKEKSVALSSVPQAAKDAAKQALGADPTEAKVISGTHPRQYELEAEATNGGQEKAVHVTGSGKILKPETENESQEKGER